MALTGRDAGSRRYFRRPLSKGNVTSIYTSVIHKCLAKVFLHKSFTNKSFFTSLSSRRSARPSATRGALARLMCHRVVRDVLFTASRVGGEIDRSDGDIAVFRASVTELASVVPAPAARGSVGEKRARFVEPDGDADGVVDPLHRHRLRVGGGVGSVAALTSLVVSPALNRATIIQSTIKMCTCRNCNEITRLRSITL